jgi:hypothetical protein
MTLLKPPRVLDARAMAVRCRRASFACRGPGARSAGTAQGDGDQRLARRRRHCRIRRVPRRLSGPFIIPVFLLTMAPVRSVEIGLSAPT